MTAEVKNRKRKNSKVCCRFTKRLKGLNAIRVKTYVEDDHLDRILYRCELCGCLFFYEFYEVIMLSDGDKIYVTTFHVEDEFDSDRLAKLNPFGLMVEAGKRPHIFE